MRKSWLTAGVIIVVVLGISTSILQGQATEPSVARTASQGWPGLREISDQTGLTNLPAEKSQTIVSSTAALVREETRKRHEAQQEAERLAEVEAQEREATASAGAGPGAGSSQPSLDGEWRSKAVPYERELALQIWGSEEQAQALSNILDNERYDRNPWCSPEYDGSCGYGLGQKIDGWDDSYQPGNWQQQVQWVIEYIRFSSHGYGDAITAWEVKKSTGSY